MSQRHLHSHARPPGRIYFHVIGDERILKDCVWAAVFYITERDLQTDIGHQSVGNHAPVDRIFTVKINFPLEGAIK